MAFIIFTHSFFNNELGFRLSNANLKHSDFSLLTKALRSYRSNSFDFIGSQTTFSSLPLAEGYCCLAGSAWRQVWLSYWRKFALNLLFQAYGTPILKPVYRKTPHHRAHWGVILEATKGVPSAWRSLQFSETLIMRSEENIFFPQLSSLQCHENVKGLRL